MEELQKWTVTTNFIAGKYMYAVCRVKNPNEPVHSGNLEFASGYSESREDIQHLADLLNKNEVESVDLDEMV